MQINELMCNRRADPIGIGYDAVLSWNYSTEYRRDLSQINFRIEAAYDINFIYTIHDSGIINSDNMNYNLGEAIELDSSRIYYWRVTVTGNDGQSETSRTASFETALLDAKLWDVFGSHWITADGEEPAAPVFFTETKPMSGRIVSARAYVYSFGFSYLCINKTRCSHRLLSPPNTQYDRRCLYETYDITPWLDCDKSNLIEICVGAGYGETYSKWGWRFMGNKGVRAVFLITYDNGTIARFATDENWSMRTGEVERCDIYGGETYNAAVEGFNVQKVIADNSRAPAGALIPNTMPHIRPYDYIKPAALWTNRCKKDQDDNQEDRDNDKIIYDFGVNIAGFAEIAVEADRGTNITLEFAETIEEDGGWNPVTNREALATDVYICSGFGVERWHPDYTYHGFRYVRVSGVSNTRSFDIMAYAVCADLHETGSFGCSDAAVNRIHEHCRRSMRANFMSIPTDCPARDERTPCSMDSQTIEEAAIYNFDMLSYYSKWIDDIAGQRGNPDWAGDQIYLVWRLYRYYGDKSIVVRHYDKLKAYLACLESESNGYLMENGFGDWCNPNNDTWDGFFGSVTAVNTCLFYSMAVKMEYLAEVIGREGDAAAFAALAGKIKKAFFDACLKADGTILSGKMTEQLMPLYFKMADEKSGLVFDKLMETVRDKGYMDTGIYGTMAFLDVLSDGGERDAAYGLITQPAYPGFVWQMANGATSLWEQWAYGGSMHSHNHGFFAGIDASFYKYYGGVETIEPAFRNFTVKPRLPRGISWAGCRLYTVSGEIEVKTEYLSYGTEMSVTVPPNTTAEVWIPVPEDDFTLFDGERLLDIAGFERRGRYLFKKTGSGIYHFRAVVKTYSRL
ncbi:MAG: family 78 glycoside hydrolase catalytic domain [Eubacteriales bacterium]|nr:family 78 glycoside hydrolase catalytic domain [Eubacteriales bacterium]